MAETTHHLSILLAEDNPVNQKVALLLLKRLGHQADVANNGLEVLTAIKQRQYDIIFMDVQMPEMDGLAATKHIYEQLSPEKRPWIIAMTANAMDGDREVCIAAGMNDYVTKPIRIEALEKVLAQHPSR
jgi:CheY-like chemotaxis protein